MIAYSRVSASSKLIHLARFRAELAEFLPVSGSMKCKSACCGTFFTASNLNSCRTYAAAASSSGLLHSGPTTQSAISSETESASAVSVCRCGCGASAWPHLASETRSFGSQPNACPHLAQCRTAFKVSTQALQGLAHLLYAAELHRMMNPVQLSRSELDERVNMLLKRQPRHWISQTDLQNLQVCNGHINDHSNGRTGTRLTGSCACRMKTLLRSFRSVIWHIQTVEHRM